MSNSSDSWGIPNDLEIHHMGVRYSHIASPNSSRQDNERIQRVKDSLATFGASNSNPNPTQESNSLAVNSNTVSASGNDENNTISSDLIHALEKLTVSDGGSDSHPGSGSEEAIAVSTTDTTDGSNRNATPSSSSRPNQTNTVDAFHRAIKRLYHLQYILPRFQQQQQSANQSGKTAPLSPSGPHIPNQQTNLSPEHHAVGIAPASEPVDPQQPQTTQPPSGSGNVTPNTTTTELTSPPASNTDDPAFPLAHLAPFQRAAIECFLHAAHAIKEANNIVIVCGAGISVSAGIPDFRSENGLYSILKGIDLSGGDKNADWMKTFQPDLLFDLSYFVQNPIPFYAFYFGMDTVGTLCKPTPAHRFIALLESQQKLLRCYTQNIDNLELKAGITRSIPCHGNDREFHCTKCKARVSIDKIQGYLDLKEIPYCQAIKKHLLNEAKQTARDTTAKDITHRYNFTIPSCNAPWKPAIVFFGEQLPKSVFDSLAEDRGKADLIIVMGTSLQVAPVSAIPMQLSFQMAAAAQTTDKSGGRDLTKDKCRAHAKSSLEYMQINSMNVPIFTINKEPLGDQYYEPLDDFLDGHDHRDILHAHTLVKSLENDSLATSTSAENDNNDTNTFPTSTITPTPITSSPRSLLPCEESMIDKWDPFFSKRTSLYSKNPHMKQHAAFMSKDFDYEFLGNADDVCSLLVNILDLHSPSSSPS